MGGMEQRVQGMWWCGICDREVDEGQLEAHLNSRRHQNGLESERERQTVLARSARGELPDFLEVRDGEFLWCKLCWAYATDEHLRSAKHKKREAWPTNAMP